MKITKILMGMPITVEIIESKNCHSEQSEESHSKNNWIPDQVRDDTKNITLAEVFQNVFDYFTYVDETFSTYKNTSEISKFNNNEVKEKNLSKDMQEIFFLAEQTKHETHGYFDIKRNGILDPSGIVKGWAIENAAKLIKSKGYTNFYIDAGGDIAVSGEKSNGEVWKVGIRNPFNRNENVKVLQLTNKGVATSGTYIRGQHVYNPFFPDKKLTNIVSITVIGPNIYEADRFATAAFAMQENGIQFIQTLPGFEGYMINKDGIATYTTGFERYVVD